MPNVKAEDESTSVEISRPDIAEKDSIPVGRETFVVNKNVEPPTIKPEPKFSPETSQVLNNQNTPCGGEHMTQSNSDSSTDENTSTTKKEQTMKEFYHVKHMSKATKAVPIIKQKSLKPLDRYVSMYVRVSWYDWVLFIGVRIWHIFGIGTHVRDVFSKRGV